MSTPAEPPRKASAPGRSSFGRALRTTAVAGLGLLSFLFALAGGLSGGLSGALIALGLPLFLLGLAATVVGSVRWAFIASRKVGALVLAAGLATTFAGGALAPAPASGPTASTTTPETTGTTPTGDVPQSGDKDSDATSTSAPPTATPPTSATALMLLGQLEVKGRAPRTGYDRELFGQRWADVDRNGCDTRNDILRRDLTNLGLKAGTNGCIVLTGMLADPFSGASMDFQRGEGTSELVQIDHVVALSDAWQKGAQQWMPERRVAFANDPLNLLAVDGGLNAQKGDADAATWLPPNRSFRCAYVARQVAVKVKYGAWVTAAERDAIARVLADCPAEPVPASDAPTESSVGAAGASSTAPQQPPAQAAPAAPPAAPGESCDAAYPDVCIPPYAEVGDLDCGDVPHRRFAVRAPDPHGFDGNSDGVGCES